MTRETPRNDESVVDSRDRNSVASVEKAMALLSALARASRPMTPAELANALAMSQTGVYRLLRALAKSKAVERLPRGAYVLGSLAQELATAFDARSRMRQAAADTMIGLRETCGGETVGLYSQINFGQFVCIETLPGFARNRYLEQLNRPIPIARGTTSLVLLADMWSHYGPGFVERYLRGVQPHNPTQPIGQHMEQIEKTQSQRFAVSHGTRLPGLSAIAAPIENELGHMVGIVTLSAPSARLNGHAISAWRPRVTAAAQTISSSLIS